MILWSTRNRDEDLIAGNTQRFGSRPKMANPLQMFSDLNADVVPGHGVGFRDLIIDNACLLFPNVALNCFRIITREQYDEASTAWHFHAYLMNIDLSEENPDERTIEVLLDTRSIAAFPTYLRTQLPPWLFFFCSLRETSMLGTQKFWASRDTSPKRNRPRRFLASLDLASRARHVSATAIQRLIFDFLHIYTFP